MPVILKVINMCQLTQTLNGHLKLLMSNFVYTYLPYHKFITRGSFEPFLIFHNTEKKKKERKLKLLTTNWFKFSFSFQSNTFRKGYLSKYNWHKKKILYTFNVENLMSFSSVPFSLSVMSNSLQCHGPQHIRPPCPSPTPGIYSNSCPLWIRW